MLAPKLLRKPLNWQDFESLCKKLWGEIWDCREIKKNGRTGQAQNGVDIYGMPFGETEYYGIQCKGKDEYANKQFTKEEVMDEIAKAKGFKPALKKLYFATTANKDAVIEEFVRIQNLSHIKLGLFEVHLFCWEDIAELIEENRQTYNYYMESQNFKNTTSVLVSFETGETEVTLAPKFKQKKTVYRKNFGADLVDGLTANLSNLWANNPGFNNMIRVTNAYRSKGTQTNLSYAKFCLVILNTGTDPLEDYKASFWFEGDIQDLTKTNVTNDIPALILPSVGTPRTYVDAESKTIELIPRDILVGDDNFTSADIFIKCAPVAQDITLHWKLLSRRFKTDGKLTLHIKPEIESEFKQITVDDVAEERIEPGAIEDFIELKQ